ncbi:cytochrome P450, family 94, subfamily B, polypeptide 1 [Hibiscus trionum]|uniref:Cytochrome P450, family 94, subfamily B, polypeptide 1 n=1 Tax=Hibiscus trionum TaxID=183268 RepID=A0A9W7HYH0_HIBTR|nr:cytochrome P450, family 94, subfamily B, polypeptide 1 [Hibiscus trionum]
MFIQLLALTIIFFLGLPLLLIVLNNNSKSQKSASKSNGLPKRYPIIGSFFDVISNQSNRVQWITQILQNCPSATYTLHLVLGYRQILTANPENVQHVLKTHFNNYPKGYFFINVFFDFLGNGIFNVDGESWKFERQVSSHEFNTKSLRKFVETVVDTELHDRLIPMLSGAASGKTVLDLQDVLQRFAFDNICKIAFGHDPACLLPSLPQTQFADAFEDATHLSSERFRTPLFIIWRMKRFFNVGSEKKLKIAISRVRDFAKEIVREKKRELADKSSLESVDLLSRFLNSGHTDEDFATDIVISFILAGRDTTSAALTWFFWLIYKHPEVEKEILGEIKEKSDMPVYEEVKDMVYIHASLCEAMRLYPPVPTDTKLAAEDDVLPDGTVVKKGTLVTYAPYAMGRMEKIWGSDWAEFKPERWLQRDDAGRWSFVGRDPYTYPVFQAGPRICLGKEMAFLQMKRLVAGVLRRFRVVPAVEEGFQPVFVAYLTAKMKGGFPVKVEERGELD